MACRSSFARNLVAAAALVSLCGGCMFARGEKAAEPTPAVTPPPEASKTAATNSTNATPAELAAILNEVQQLGALDPEAQNALLEDLKKTDPALWPQLVQTFRASIAYRQQAVQRNQRLAEQNGAANPAVVAQPRALEVVPSAHALPQAEQGALPPVSPAAGFASNYPDTNLPAVKLVSAVTLANETASPIPTDWRGQLAGAIRSFETQSSSNGQANSASTVDQTKLRLLQLAAGQREEALRPLSGVSGTEQDFWGEQIFGLATLLDAERLPDPERRAAEAAQHFREAAGKLSHVASLTVRNLAFATEVTSFGVYKPFAKYEFKPGQEALLYAELENFTSEPSEKGFHTSFKSSYQILDSRGARVAEQDFAVTEEHCRNARRDFFIRYFVYMPKRIYDGKYTLQLTIEDTLGKKVGQSSIEFAVVGAD
jgi:hypothetical protein